MCGGGAIEKFQYVLNESSEMNNVESRNNTGIPNEWNSRYRYNVPWNLLFDEIFRFYYFTIKPFTHLRKFWSMRGVFWMIKKCVRENIQIKTTAHWRPMIFKRRAGLAWTNERLKRQKKRKTITGVIFLNVLRTSGITRTDRGQIWKFELTLDYQWKTIFRFLL